MPMGLSFTREPLVYQEDFHVYRDQLLHLFRPITRSIPHGHHFSYSVLEESMNDDEH